MASHGTPRPATIEQKTQQARLKEHQEIKDYKELVDLIGVKVAERQYTIEVLELTSKLLSKNPEYYTIWNVRRRLLIHGLFSKLSDSSSQSKVSHNISQTATTTASSEDSSSSTTKAYEALIATQLNPNSQNLGKNGTIVDEIPANDPQVLRPAEGKSTTSATASARFRERRKEKEAQQTKILDLIKSDLDFVFSLMVSYPKCYWIWNYRLWLLQQANERLAVDVARELWQRELVLTGKMLTRDSRNFHGWGYRRKVISQLESANLKGDSMVESEFAYTTKMINAELKNFSAWHNRSKLIPRLLDNRKASDVERRQFLDDEFDLITRAIWNDAYPYDQSVWFYHQFLMTTLVEYVGHSTITPNMTTIDRVEYINRQLVNLKDFLDGGEDCKWVYNALLEYTLAVCEMGGRPPRDDEVQDCKDWLAELRKLDPLRAGRWDDLDKSLRLDSLIPQQDSII